MRMKSGTKRKRSKIRSMDNFIYGENLDIEKFADGLAKLARESVKWERRKLEWIVAEEKAAARLAKANAKKGIESA